jgi:hypothetical protein
VAEGGGLLNRYTAKTRIVGSNPIPSATQLKSNKKSTSLGARPASSGRPGAGYFGRIATGLPPERFRGVRGRRSRPVHSDSAPASAASTATAARSSVLPNRCA